MHYPVRGPALWSWPKTYKRTVSPSCRQILINLKHEKTSILGSKQTKMINTWFCSLKNCICLSFRKHTISVHLLKMSQGTMNQVYKIYLKYAMDTTGHSHNSMWSPKMKPCLLTSFCEIQKKEENSYWVGVTLSHGVYVYVEHHVLASANLPMIWDGNVFAPGPQSHVSMAQGPSKSVKTWI